jgi:dTDP-4-dehydrorhamnose 3,5-epimerase
MFEIRSTALPRVLSIRAKVKDDARGNFRKLVHAPSFIDMRLNCDFQEIYSSTSHFGSIRGMHYQAPPYQHAKLIWCLDGRVTDVVLDLRSNGGSYGHAISLELDGAAGDGIYIPEGCAHGFTVRSAQATLLYLVTSVHAPEADLGIRWDSFGFDWQAQQPILSDRDRAHPRLVDFISPF